MPLSHGSAPLSPTWAYITTFENMQALALQHQRLIFRAAGSLDLRGKENVYLKDEKAQKPPTGKTKYRFVNAHPSYLCFYIMIT